ncbi:hypothetical protein FRB90_004006, partial [Tulasnella sp. 427]
NTNIIRLFAALEKARPNEQVVYYQPGIGTYVRPEAPWAPAIRNVAMTVDKALAWYIGTHIIGGYKFLMEHYSEGDKICLFGFSRGAFTARCLAGMLATVGLLPRSNIEAVDFAYTLYKSVKKNDPKARDFKQAFSIHVEVEFVGVWDTVASVGSREPSLPFSDSETFIKTFRHALAADERRAKFQPNPWQYSRGRSQIHTFTTIDQLANSQIPASGQVPESLEGWEDDRNYHGGKLTDIFEVWFPGFHADVGGGNDKNDKFETLANPPLRWMVTEILKSNTGIVFKKDAFQDHLPSLNAKIQAFQNLAPSQPQSSFLDVKTRHASEATAVNDPTTPPLTPGSFISGKTGANSVSSRRREPTETEDANAQWHDMLEKKPLWNILEWLPLHNSWAKPDGQRDPGWGWNRGRTRSIEHLIPNLHKSIKLRMAGEAGYDPASRCKHPERLQWIDEDDSIPQNVKQLLQVTVTQA